MNQTPPTEINEPIPPPEELLNARPGEWKTLAESHPTIPYLNRKITGRARKWEGARFSKAVHLYREAVTSHSLMIKYYQPKTGANAVRHAEGELKKSSAYGRLVWQQVHCELSNRKRFGKA